MTDPGVMNIYIDGASRGNPGPAAFAYVITRPEQAAIEEMGSLGISTNNQAEYTALVRALERAQQLGGGRLVIHSDSELLVKQMNGEYRVKNPDLLSLYHQAKQISRSFEQIAIRYVPRSQNRRADLLCNEALDSTGRRKPASSPPAAKPPGMAAGGVDAAVAQEAVLCLRAAARAWAQGNPEEPPPEAVWDQLWSILEEQGLLRPRRSR
jgi:ribonuclease HI